MIELAKSWITRVRQSTLARNSTWMFLGYGVRVLVQAAYFIMIARALGPREYGAFGGATALIAIVSPFASWAPDIFCSRMFLGTNRGFPFTGVTLYLRWVFRDWCYWEVSSWWRAGFCLPRFRSC